MAALTQPSLLDTPRPSLLDSIAAERAATRRPATPRAGAAGGPTLEDMLTGAWDALQTGEPAACLACGTPMTPRYGAGSRPLGGRCHGCGSELA